MIKLDFLEAMGRERVVAGKASVMGCDGVVQSDALCCRQRRARGLTVLGGMPHMHAGRDWLGQVPGK